jgi:hypothetical protein
MIKGGIGYLLRAINRTPHKAALRSDLSSCVDGQEKESLKILDLPIHFFTF